jgi:erythronate-4-phosphate dehydrogenase
MLIMIDEAIPAAPGLFAPFGEVRTFEGRSLQAADLADADALIVRSVTRVDAALLAGSPVRFVGTATSGTDHVDEAWLAGQGIHFAAAPGCNARPVAEYVLTAILWLARHRRFDPRTRSLGVVGVGHTGSLVARWARALGMEVLLCDPPLQDAGRNSSLLLLSGDRPTPVAPQSTPSREPGVPLQPSTMPPSPEWLSPSQLLARADIITLHVPLTDAGPYATREMVNADWLAAMRPGAMLINTARGEVVSEPAVIEARRSDRLSGLVIDVWATEPAINEAFVEVCDLATPHVAGYSIEARRRAVSAIFDALAAWTGTPPPPASRAVLGPDPNRADPDRGRDQQRVGSAVRTDERVGSAVRTDEVSEAFIPEKVRTADPTLLSALLEPLETACPLSNIDARLRSAAAGPFPSAGQSVGSAVRTDERVGSAVRTDEVSEAFIPEQVRTADPTALPEQVRTADPTALSEQVRTADPTALAERFDGLRSAVSHRREFSDYRLSPVQFTPAAAEFLREVGFRFDSP